MTSNFSKGVMVSLNEHMAQTLFDGMAATIRKEKFDPDLQIQGLEMLVDNLESLNGRLSRFMGELKSNKENTFSYDELDLEGLNEWEETNSEEEASTKRISRIPSPITLNFAVPKSKFASRRLTPLFEEESAPRFSFETVVSDSSFKSKSSGGIETITIKLEMPNTPPFSSVETSTCVSLSPPIAIKREFRQIDPTKIPKRKPVPSRVQTPSSKDASVNASAGINTSTNATTAPNKAFKRKEVPMRFYDNSTAQNSSTTVNTFSSTGFSTFTGPTSFEFSRPMESIWTPPVTDEECSPVRKKRNTREQNPSLAAPDEAATSSIHQPKPRRARSKQLRIAVPHRRPSGGKLPRTPSSGSTKFQKRTMEELDKAMAAVRLSFEEKSSGNNLSGVAVKRMDSGKEKKNGSIKRRTSTGRRRRRYSQGIPRCDSPVLGQLEVVFAVHQPSRRR
ncbi:hypothetical protein Dda_4565 [Drechslerella dactyloides]|uniref:Uncharacterized protein n=1 Tax=Drechslerella dactyloides TaxID=74499 RepID=A0AAD6IX55_DREDA|nr:hypothetical protein Dda_4565 [Drechslerella dactyloides]